MLLPLFILEGCSGVRAVAVLVASTAGWAIARFAMAGLAVMVVLVRAGLLVLRVLAVRGLV